MSITAIKLFKNVYCEVCININDIMKYKWELYKDNIYFYTLPGDSICEIGNYIFHNNIKGEIIFVKVLHNTIVNTNIMDIPEALEFSLIDDVNAKIQNISINDDDYFYNNFEHLYERLPNSEYKNSRHLYEREYRGDSNINTFLYTELTKDDYDLEMYYDNFTEYDSN